MKIQAISEFLFDLTHLTFHDSILTFQQQCLSRLQALLPFDKAWWGVARQDQTGIYLHHGWVHNLPGDYPQHWESIKHSDPIGFKIRSFPGKTVAYTPEQVQAVHSLRHLYQHHALGATLCTASPYSSGLLGFLSLYREPQRAPFSRQEQATKQLLMHHLNRALQLNWLRQCESGSQQVGLSGSGFALVDQQGYLHGCQAPCQQQLQRQWPGWKGGMLPSQAWSGLVAQGHYQSDKVEMKLTRLLDVFLLEVRPPSVLGLLSPRERCIAEHYVAGLSYKEIARELHNAPSTIRHHLRTVFQKLGVSNKAELGNVIRVVRENP